MTDPRTTLDELSAALRAAGVGVYVYEGARQSARWLAGAAPFGEDADEAPPPPATATTPVHSLVTGARNTLSHQVVRLGPDGDAPRFFGVVRACSPGEIGRGALGAPDGRSGLQAHLTHLAETLPPTARIAVLALGIDGMREFCRAYGYEAGETLCRAVGEGLLQTLPPEAVLARIAGAKFVVALPGAPGIDFAAEARRITGEVQSVSFALPFGPVSVTLSAGGLVAGPAQLRSPDVLDAALAALDEARGEGDGTLVISGKDEDGPLSPAAMRAGAQAVMRALQDDRVAIAYQPIVAAAPPYPLAFRECLARVADENGRWIAAGLFLPKIERLDLVRSLDRRVLRLVLDALADHPTERLSVNVSVRTMRDRQWLGDLQAAAREDPLRVERLIVELTESAAVIDAAQTKAFLDEVRKLGVAIALDDFGAGYSSFRHVRDFRPDWVKIDGGFVRGVATDPDCKLFVDTLVGIARNFDMATVAEFVESAEDAEALQALGVDCLQGYYFGRPEIAPAWPRALASAT